MAILVLAANTASAFPRLASILSRDRFLPRQFANRGDLAFSGSILILSVLASVLLVVFSGDTHALIPLMIGVFVSFTCRRPDGPPLAHRPRARLEDSAAINGFGAAVTGVVLVIVATTKAHEAPGSSSPIPVLVTVFEITRRHYDRAGLTLRGWRRKPAAMVLVPTGSISAPSSRRSAMPERSRTTCARCKWRSIRPAPPNVERCGPNGDRVSISSC